MSTLTLPVDADHDRILGPVDAPLTLVEYGDFECPYCGRAYYELKDVEEQMGAQLRFVFRNFPITSAHPHAEAAAMAAEAAAGQGKFWDMHSMLYENQDALDDDSLWEYASALGLDLPTFDRDMTSRRFLRKVREDFMSGVRSGVNGTPTFFINGYRHEGAFDAAALLDALRHAHV
jgi:protein-disulfide isomerase